MGKILAILVCVVCLVGCNDSKPQQAVTISTDYQNAIHAQNDAIFEREKLARALHREMLMSQQGAR